MFRTLLQTPPDAVLFLLRLVLAIVFFPHGAQKTLGWFGGPGFSGMMHGFEQQGIPAVFAFLAIVAESAGAVGLFVGLLGRVAAAGILVNMLVAVVAVHGKFGFFMNWTGKQAGEGYEFHLLAIAMALAIVIRGSGLWSLDRALSARATGVPG